MGNNFTALIMSRKSLFLRNYNSLLLTNLVAGYSYENNANDVLGVNNGTATSVSYATGINGNAVSFTAQNQYISVPDADVFSFVGVPFSISTWIYTTAYSSSGNRFLNKSESTTREWLCNMSSTNIAIILYSTPSISRSKSLAHGFSLNTWYHIAYTYDGTDIKIYKNGIDLGGSTIDVGGYVGMVNTTIPVRIGNMNTISNSNHLGRLDETYIWNNRTLTPADVLELYNSGVGKFYPF